LILHIYFRQPRIKNKNGSTIYVSSKNNSLEWNKPSGGAYPTQTKGEDIGIDVSIHDQKIYIKDGDKTIYTMIISSGLDTIPDNTTPTGTFYDKQNAEPSSTPLNTRKGQSIGCHGKIMENFSFIVSQWIKTVKYL
jgi:hypothetical protein